MMLKIRLRQQGRKNCLMYRLVLSESRSPRDGKYIESLGWYNPHQKETANDACIKEARVLYWLRQGAVLSEKARSLVARQAPEVIVAVQKDLQQKREKARLKKAEARRKKGLDK